mmetsp:Transcript_57339/g.125579  ORF Transcript_57339/g.125579 Transcript_57339/m.125579 type:complete len:313 (+) Transcript_57339:352-1290(+)
MGCAGSSIVGAGTTGAPRPRPEAADDEEIAARASRRDSREKSLAVTSTLSGAIAASVELKQMQSKKSSIVVSGINSQAFFSKSDQTIIIFDWDDTLCPSSSMKPFAEFDRQGKLRRKLPSDVRNELKLLTDVVVPLLKMAKTMGHVIMVTNARAPWVDISCQNFLPAVKEHLADIPVTYALELVDMDNPKDFDESTGCLLTETKARAMKAAVSQFYSRYPGQSWKNIVSIGDAYFEHDAIRQVVGNKDQAKKCRTKTIKLLEGPTTAGMVVQLSILKGWLQQIVQTDTDIDIDLMDEENVSKWVDLYGTPQD